MSWNSRDPCDALRKGLDILSSERLVVGLPHLRFFLPTRTMLDSQYIIRLRPGHLASRTAMSTAFSPSPSK